MKKRLICFSLVCLMLFAALTLTATAGESVAAPEENKTDYASLYVQDGLVYFFFADGMTAGKTVSSLPSRVGDASLTKSTSGREYYNYLKQNELSMKVTDDGKGVWFSSFTTAQLDLTPVIPQDENGNMTDMTLEVSQKYLSSAVAGYGGSMNVWGPYGEIKYSRVNEGASTSSPYTADGRGPIKSWNSSSVFKAYDHVSNSPYTPLFNHEAGSFFTTSFSFDYTASADGVHDYVFIAGRNGASVGTHTGVYKTSEDKTPAFFYKNVDGNKAAGKIFTDDQIDCDYIVVPIDANGNYVPLDGRTLNLAVNKNATSTSDTDPSDVITFNKVAFLVKDENGTLAYKKDGVNEEKYREMTLDDMKPVTKWGFTYGASCSTAFSSIRVYNRVLTDAELAQNHFVDLAYALDADLTAYEAASADLKAKAHEAFKNVDESSMTAEEFASELESLLKTGGAYPADGFDGALSFLGHQMRLYGLPAFRTLFEVDMDAVSAVDGFSVKELGVLTFKVDADDPLDFEALALIENEDGNYTVGEGIRREIAYGGDVNALREGVFYALTEADATSPVYTDEYVSRAYMIVAYREGTAQEQTFVSYCNAEGDEDGLGNSVSLYEMASALIGTNPESTNVSHIYLSQGVDTELALSALQSALEDAKAHYDAVNARYDGWLNSIEEYKTNMVAYQKTALHASKYADLTNAKNAAKTLKNTADKAYGEYSAYLSTEREADMQSACEFADAVALACTTLRFVANSTDNDALLKTVEDALTEAESYYQGLSRSILPKELTISRAKTKIDSAYSALSGYILNTGVKARMYVLGDSTVCTRASTSAVQGWVDQFIPSTKNSLEIINYAKGGWSFKGMIYTTVGTSDYDINNYTDAENSAFGKVLDVAGEGDFVVFASTSPNDLWQDGRDFFYKVDEFGQVTYATRVSKSEQYFIDENGKRIDLTKDNCAKYGYEMYTWKATPNEYYHMLKDCIDQTLEAGATPILVTSCGGLSNTSATTRDFTITRNGVTTNYKAPMAIPGKITSSVEAYEEVKRILTAEYEGKVILIDPTPLVFAEYEKLFDEAVIEANQIKKEKGQIDYVDAYVEKTNITAAQYARYKLLSVYNADTSDNTHQGKAGASLVAEKIVEILRDPGFDCDLKNYLIEEN